VRLFLVLFFFSFLLVGCTATGERGPRTDLLAEENRSKWIEAGPVELEFRDGNMVAKSIADACGQEGRGLVLSGRNDRWIDFDVEFECTIKRGGFVILGRYADNQHFFQLNFETGGKGNPIVDGGAYKVRVQSVGRGIFFEIWDEKGQKIEIEGSPFEMPSVARAGTFGFGITPGAEVTFHSIQARVVHED